MRALTIRQPCATLCAAGLKPIENRTKPFPSTVAIVQGGEVYRVAEVREDGPVFLRGGPTIAIHAGKATHDGCWRTAYRVLGDDLAAHPAFLQELPAGAVVGTARLGGWHHADECERRCECWCHRAMAQPRRSCCGPDCDGTVYCSPWALPDMWHWQLADAHLFADPLPAAGHLGLWNIDLEEATP